MGYQIEKPQNQVISWEDTWRTAVFVVIKNTEGLLDNIMEHIDSEVIYK